MSWMNVPTPSNEQSWLKMIEFAESMPDTNWKKWKNQIVPLLREGIESALHRHFLAGQSMQHLLFSVIDHYGLDEEPRVTIGFDEKMDLFVALTTFNIWFQQPTDRAELSGENNLSLLRQFLVKLWITAKPDQPLPSELQNA
ncbi:MAG: hypothetical protein H6978_15690 [Gammaproteobacteria bacterium]|nr:hypothetical protein [Gammaproteobacteria bacterium]